MGREQDSPRKWSRRREPTLSVNAKLDRHDSCVAEWTDWWAKTKAASSVLFSSFCTLYSDYKLPVSW